MSGQCENRPPLVQQTMPDCDLNLSTGKQRERVSPICSIFISRGGKTRVFDGWDAMAETSVVWNIN